MSCEPKVHIPFFPFVARSHMIPMFNTAIVIGSRCVKATIVTTPANAHLVAPTITRSTNDGHTMALFFIPFLGPQFGLPEGLENLTDVPDSLIPNFHNAFNALRDPINRLLGDLRPDGLISDWISDWSTEVARAHGLPRIIFLVTANFYTCAEHALAKQKPFLTSIPRDELFEVPYLPHRVKLTKSQLAQLFTYPSYLESLMEVERNSFGVILNSFYALEPDYVEHFSKAGPRSVYCVGPVAIAAAATTCDQEETKTQHECLNWLDKKEPESVVYICIGSLFSFSTEQLRELAFGIEESGHQFLWVVNKKDGVYDWIPEGYEERMRGKGLMVRDWAPQKEILNHKAIGGFLCYCGWGSVMEAITAGVPMATWPLQHDQFVVEKFLVEVGKIATMVWDGFKSVADEDKVVIKAEVVAMALARLMGSGEEAEGIRRRAREYSKMARAAVVEAGTSYLDMSRLIQDIDMYRKEKREKVTKAA